ETQRMSGVGTWEVDLISGALSWSAENCRIFGVPEQTAPTYELFLGKVHPDDREKVIHHYEEALRTGLFAIEYRLNLDGEIRWVHGKANVALDNGKPIYVLGFTHDITERKTSQQAQLLSSQLSALGEVAAGVAHEINNPITGIINCAQIVLNRAKVDPGEQEALIRIVKEGDRIASIVSNLLNFAQKDRTHMELLSLGDLVSGPVQLFVQMFMKDGIQFEFDIPDGLPCILGNQMQLEQVILNMLSNARHALNKKYPELSDHKLVSVSARKRDKGEQHYIEVSVRDNGSGIPSAHLEKIFQPFFTTKAAGVGTGLGLSISREILQNHGGNISIDSLEGEYTHVTILLPAS
ncbi:MAG: hypothetical protein C0614_09545, partial [Desulfuromonas sp.]